MLNISRNSIRECADWSRFGSLRLVESKKAGNVLMKTIYWTLGILFVILMLPWTQNIQSRGSVIALRPEQRPQTIQSVISGRIEKWFVQEGDYVHRGDTILLISEVKSEYLDPELVQRVQEQLAAKEKSVQSYTEKVQALEQQIGALIKIRDFKQTQAANKLQQALLAVESDSMELEAARINFNIARARYQRMENMYEQGLRSLTDLEARKNNFQKAQANLVAKENKLLASRNKAVNARVELASVKAQYNEKIAKAQSDKFTALSNRFNAEAMAAKLRNQLANYTLRSGLYYITAPQSGYITQAIRTGIGETVKAGEDIVSIMPARYDLAVALYVRPIDLPLVEKGQHVRIQFDGWPAIVFSGWPNTSHGTYGGTVYAIDNFISENGMYRVLVVPDTTDYPWPEALRVGGGTRNMLLLQDVPVWYELWRKINGFPPNYYKPVSRQKGDKK